MVAIVSNWCDVEGTVLRVRPDGLFAVVDVRVQQVSDVAGARNLLARTANGHLAISLPEEAACAAGVRVGARLHARVRRAGPTGVYAHPDFIKVTPPDGNGSPPA